VVPSLATNYERGRAFEYRVRDHFMKVQNACFVMRAAGSHTIADLIVLWPYHYVLGSQVGLVQCKRDGRLSAEERELLISLAKETDSVAILAKAGPGGRGVVTEQLFPKQEEDHG